MAVFVTIFGTFIAIALLFNVYRFWRYLKCRWERDAEKSPKCALCDHETLIDEEGREVDDEFIVGDYECPACGYSPAWRGREDVGELVEALEKLDGVRIQFADIAFRASIWTPSRKQSSGMLKVDSQGRTHDEERLLNDAWKDIKQTQREYPEAFEVSVEGAPSAALLVEKFEHVEPGQVSTKMLIEKIHAATDFRWRALETKAVFDLILEGIRDEIRRRVDRESSGDRRSPSGESKAGDASLTDVELPEAPTTDIPILGRLERALRR